MIWKNYSSPFPSLSLSLSLSSTEIYFDFVFLSLFLLGLGVSTKHITAVKPHLLETMPRRVFTAELVLDNLTNECTISYMFRILKKALGEDGEIGLKN